MFFGDVTIGLGIRRNTPRRAYIPKVIFGDHGRSREKLASRRARDQTLDCELYGGLDIAARRSRDNRFLVARNSREADRSNPRSSDCEALMTSESGPAAYRRRLDEILVEAGEPPLVSTEAHEFYNSGLSCEDALILKLFGADQSAPRDLTEAFDRTFGGV
jgi:hypothetical protein